MSTHNLLSRYNYRAERWKSVIQSQHNVLTNSPAKEKHDKINEKNFLHNLPTENTARN